MQQDRNAKEKRSIATRASPATDSHFHDASHIMKDSEQLSTPNSYIENNVVDLEKKLDLGIAFSGGGQRASVLTLGWIRALHRLGIWQKAKYVSVVSGAAWTVLPLELSLYSDNAKNFESLAGITQPIEKDKLLTIDGDLQDRMNKAHMNDFYQSGSWRSAIDKFYFESSEREITYGELYNQAIINRADWPSPFLIVNAAIVNTTSSSNKGFIPFEFTMAYCGIPCDPAVTLEAYPLHDGSKQTTKLKMGYIPPDMFHVKSPEDCLLISGIPTASTFRVCDIAAITSDYVVQLFYQTYNRSSWLLQTVMTIIQLLGTVVYRGMSYYFYNSDMKGGLCLFTDGGAIESTGVTALLRRNTKNIIICSATGSDVLDKNSHSRYHTDGMSLFGVAHSDSGFICGQTVENYNKMRQVFDSNEWQKLIESFEDCKASDRAYVHSTRLQVKENKYLGISPYVVNAVFVYNSKCGNWENLVEKAHPELVEKMRNGEIKSSNTADVSKAFPFIKLSSLNYTDDLVSLMSNLSAYVITTEFRPIEADMDLSGSFDIRDFCSV